MIINRLESLTFCCNLYTGILDKIYDLLPNIKYLNLKAKNEDQFIRDFESENVPDMKRFLYLTTLVDEGTLLYIYVSL
jgi:hypothetical protein